MTTETASKVDAIVITRTLKSPIEKVFAAWTDARLMAKWFLPNDRWLNSEVTIDLTVGGAYTITMTHSDGDCVHLGGKYVEIIPNTKVAFTWASLDEPTGTESYVTIDLKDLGGSTELTLTHDRIPTENEKEQILSGWPGCLTSLEALLVGESSTTA